MRHWNSIIAEIEREQLYLPLISEDRQTTVPGRQWARGFMREARLRWDDWKEMLTDDREGQLLTISLVAGEIDPDWPHDTLAEEKREELLAWMAAGFARAYRRFERERRQRARLQGSPSVHSAVRIGRNESCPCGSGRKYKRCCGAHEP
jgi:uncharacterized protein